jgi:hypothetical protein
MATSTYLSNPIVSVNSVDISDQCTAATLNNRVDQLESTAFGDTARKYTAGLGNYEVTLSLYMSYASSETYATLSSLVGTTTNITITPASGSASATNPAITITGAFLAELPVINATMGELSTVDVTFTGGTYSVATT